MVTQGAEVGRMLQGKGPQFDSPSLTNKVREVPRKGFVGETGKRSWWRKKSRIQEGK